MPWDVNKSISHLKGNAKPGSTGHCAQYVREAIEAGGFALARHDSAKDYGPSLQSVGFIAVPAGTVSRPGDIAVIQPIPGHPHGHMAMFDGRNWISDFVQTHPSAPYPGPTYRRLAPSYTVFRSGGAPQAARSQLVMP
jgi:hypothetical protein